MLSLRDIALPFPLALTLMMAPPAAAEGPDSSSAGRPMRPAAVTQGAPGDKVRTPLIVGGTPAGPADNPFQVGLLLKSKPGNFEARFCGGALIAPDVVVTAAHCSYHQPTLDGPRLALRPEEVQVLTGTRNLNQGGSRWDVVSIVNHPNYNPAGNHDYDVAVWKLRQRVEGVPLAQLAISDGVPGSELLVTGWGATTEGGEESAILLKVSVPVVSHDACSAVDSGITPRMLCAGFKVGGKDACQGDSGGPATRGRGNMTLTGIVSTGEGCAQPNHYGVYTRVSDPSIRDFIRENMNSGAGRIGAEGP